MQIPVIELVQGTWLGPSQLTQRQYSRARTKWVRIGLTASVIVSDSVAVSIAFVLAYVIRFRLDLGSFFYEPPVSPASFYSSLVFWLVPLCILVLVCYRLYSPRLLFDGMEEYSRIVSSATVSIMVVVLLSFLLDSALVISRGWILISWFCLLVCLISNRFVARRIVYRLRRTGRLGRRVLVVGCGEEASDLATRISLAPESGLYVAAVVDPAHVVPSDDPVTSGSRLKQLIDEAGCESVIVSTASVSQSALSSIVRDLTDHPTELQVVPGMHEILTTGVYVREVRGLPLVTMNKVRITGFDLAMKWALDYFVAALTLLLLSPMLILIACAVAWTSPGPVFHRRPVIGQRGQRFNALKFRTMYVDGEAMLEAMPELAEQLAATGKLIHDPRVTPIGRWLRRWSIDELPQLLNVLKGQMSLVGPRMITEDELDRFGRWSSNLSTVKPGLTGLWQISGRSNLGYEDRVRLDMHYIKNYSIWTDIEILARTGPAVLAGVGAY